MIPQCIVVACFQDRVCCGRRLKHKHIGIIVFSGLALAGGAGSSPLRAVNFLMAPVSTAIAMGLLENERVIRGGFLKEPVVLQRLRVVDGGVCLLVSRAAK